MPASDDWCESSNLCTTRREDRVDKRESTNKQTLRAGQREDNRQQEKGGKSSWREKRKKQKKADKQTDSPTGPKRELQWSVVSQREICDKKQAGIDTGPTFHI